MKSKKVVLTALLFAFSSIHSAMGQANSVSTSSANSNSGSSATNIFNSPSNIRSRSTIDTTSNAYAPGLTSAGLNSCAGSTTIGGAGTGFSFGGGTTWEMEECTRRANAAALAGIGQVAAAREILCDSPAMSRALARTGYICIEQRTEYLAAVERAQASGQMVVALPGPIEEASPVVNVPTRRGPPRIRQGVRKSNQRAVSAAVDQSLSNSGR